MIDLFAELCRQLRGSFADGTSLALRPRMTTQTQQPQSLLRWYSAKADRRVHNRGV
jgi:hypothetical protein